jgi:methionyl aminopeptidase
MAVSIKSPEQIEQMRVAGRLAAEVLEVVKPPIKPGVTTEELDDICREHIVKVQQAIPANVGYKGFPKTICTSVNHVICHGIPSHSKILKDGDIVNIDVTVIKDGWHGDTSRMYYVGKPDVRAQRLCTVTFEAMMLGIEQVRPGATLGDIGNAIQRHVEGNGFSVVREYCGHGIGTVSRGSAGAALRPARRRIAVARRHDVHDRTDGQCRQAADAATGWLDCRHRDHSLSAQWEHTIAVTDKGFEILTPWPVAA